MERERSMGERASRRVGCRRVRGDGEGTEEWEGERESRRACTRRARAVGERESHARRGNEGIGRDGSMGEVGIERLGGRKEEGRREGGKERGRGSERERRGRVVVCTGRVAGRERQ